MDTGYCQSMLPKHKTFANPSSTWKAAFNALASRDVADQKQILELFLSDESSLDTLSSLDPFPPATPKTRSDYEARTTATNLTQSSDGQYDIQQLKDDSLWLSREAKIDEVSALRIVILEWQGRPAARMLAGYTEEERLSLQQAVDGTDLGASTLPQRYNTNSINGVDAAFESEDSRRARHLYLLLSERASVLAVHFIVTSASLGEPLEPEKRLYGPGEGKGSSSSPLWMEGICSKLDEAGTRRKDQEQDVIVSAIRAIEKRLECMEAGSGWPSLGDATGPLEQAFRASQLDEIYRILQLTFVRISRHERTMPAKAVQPWFQAMDKYGFFERFQPVCEL